jgi:hypothetical protein
MRLAGAFKVYQKSTKFVTAACRRCYGFRIMREMSLRAAFASSSLAKRSLVKMGKKTDFLEIASGRTKLPSQRHRYCVKR